eukprot:Awhi_evm1s3595
MCMCVCVYKRVYVLGAISLANLQGEGFAKDVFYNGSDGDLEVDIGHNAHFMTSYRCCELKGLDIHGQIHVKPYSCITPDNVLVVNQNATDILPHFDCCAKDEFFNEKSKNCQVCIDPPYCSSSNQECLSKTTAFSCLECIVDYYLNTTTETCQSCKKPDFCLKSDSDKSCDLISWNYPCSGCDEGYFLNQDINQCLACQQDQPFCQEYAQTCISDTQVMQCLKCIDPSKYELTESGICEPLPSSKALVIALSSSFASLLLIGVIVCIVAWYMYRKREFERKTKLYGMSPEDFVLGGVSRADDLRTDEEYYTETGNRQEIHATADLAKCQYFGVDNENTAKNYISVGKTDGNSDYFCTSQFHIESTPVFEETAIGNNEKSDNSDEDYKYDDYYMPSRTQSSSSTLVLATEEKDISTENIELCHECDDYDMPSMEPTSSTPAIF